MLKSNLTSKTFESATQTSKLRKTTSKKTLFNPFAGLNLPEAPPSKPEIANKPVRKSSEESEGLNWQLRWVDS